MRKVYYDNSSNSCVSVFIKNAEVLPAGVSVYSMSVKAKNKEYQRYAKEYDIHFIFDDNMPKIDFYTIPKIDIFAMDSEGGLFGTVGETTDLESKAQICYINASRESYIIAESLKEFLENGNLLKNNMQLSENIKVYGSQNEAAKEVEFVSLDEVKGY